MRELKILNKNYEVANLYTVVYEGYTIKEIIEDTPVFSVTPPQHYLDYWQKIYDYFKTGTKVPGYTYLPQGQSKYDVAYTNKTIDDPIAELNGHTLREVFEDEASELNVDFDFSKGYDGWTYSRTITQESDGVRLSADGSLNEYNLVFSGTNLRVDDHYYYTKIKFEILCTNTRYTMVRTADIFPIELQNDFPLQNDIIELSHIQQAQSNGTSRLELRQYFTNIADGNGDLMKVYYAYHLDLNKLGISPTTDMDYYYSLYQARKDIIKKVLTYADIFEGYNVFPELNNYANAAGVQTINASTNDLQVTNDPNESSSQVFYNIIPDLEDGHKYYRSINNYDTDGAAYFRIANRHSLTALEGMSSDIFEFEFIDYTHINIRSYPDALVPTTYYKIKDVKMVDLEHFDESINKEQLDTMLAHYLLVKNIVIYPEIYVPTDPTGFGNRYSFLELNKKVYGHELDFENMQLNLLFGVYRNAYDSYNQLMNFIIGNEGIISYDYGKGVRYSDIRLIKSPKTELDDGRYLKEKFDFKRLTPFYTLEQGSSLTIKNTHDWDLKLIVSGTVNTNFVFIEAEETTSGLLKVVRFDFTAVTKPFNFYYNSETKQILINSINNGYQYIDFTQGISFISLPKDTEHLIWTTGITNPSITVKKWVID